MEIDPSPFCGYVDYQPPVSRRISVPPLTIEAFRQLLVVLKLVVKLTPTGKDDAWLASITPVIEIILGSEDLLPKFLAWINSQLGIGDASATPPSLPEELSTHAEGAERLLAICNAVQREL